MDLPVVANFDELRRCQDVLTDGTAEIEFRNFLEIVREMRSNWQETVAEARRLQQELDELQRKFEECMHERSDFETKLFHARRLLEAESKARRQLEEKLSAVCDFLHTDREMDNQMRTTLASFNVPCRKRRSKSDRCSIQQNTNEINSTCSFLSDLSMTMFEDDLLDITKAFKKRRSSNLSDEFPYVQRRSSIRRSTDSIKRYGVADLGEQIANAKCDTSFKLTSSSSSSSETITKSILYNDLDRLTSVDSVFEPIGEEDKQSNGSVITLQTLSNNKENESPISKSPELIITSLEPKNPKNGIGFMLTYQTRSHDFSTRTVLRLESCAYCLKKFRFGCSAQKCRSCRVYVHQDCEAQFNKTCIAKGQGKFLGKQGYIYDYVAEERPMIPSFIVLCINEVDRRGLKELGIYRISGSDKEIKSLKERFLRGKVPSASLTTIDIHVICGCIKDFLRNLKEPLIPTDLWPNFANAVQAIDDATIKQNLFAAVNLLPQANRDTLAFLILHLQRVGDCTVNQMPIENLSKIFGPTVIGYSSAEPDYHTIFSETMIQKDVMENLLKIPTNYWIRYLNVPKSQNIA